MKILKYIIIILFLLPYVCQSANFYADTPPAESGSGWDGVNGHSYTGSPGVGTGYTTIQAGVTAMSAGDTLYMREDTYSFSGSSLSINGKHGTSWDEGNYFKMCSYPGEWAILDGERNTTEGVVIHATWPAYGTGKTASYWWFDRFEVTGGGKESGGATGSAFWINVGPFKYRYLYIHDNLSYTYTDNAAGLSGVYMKDCIIEYCWFANNGSDGATSHNNSNICFYSNDPDKIETATDGYNPVMGGTINNIVRYNYFEGDGGAVGIKNKIDQYFTGRNPDAGHGWDDTYNDYGNKIHHNFFYQLPRESLFIAQDFAQIYKNIVVESSIVVQYAPGIPQFYKCLVYNNSIIDPSNAAIKRYGAWNYGRFEFNQSATRSHYGWDYNNLIQGGTGSNPWGEEEIINVIPRDNGAEQFTLTSYIGSYNYFYESLSADVFRLGDTSYTPAEYEAQGLTGTPRVVYSTSGSTPFIGVSGADQYITDGSFVLEGATTIASGGVGGNHPYLSGVIIPSYIGATNPDDNDWVDGVLSLANISNLRDGGPGDPDWIEGGGPTPPELDTSVIAANGITATLTFSENISQGSGYNDSDWDMDCSTTGNDIGMTYVSGNTTTTHVYTLASTVQDSGIDTCTIDFNGDANSMENDTDDDLEAIVDGEVTNNSTQSVPTSTISGGYIY